ncbi:hypothetical protein NPIL_590491 [Nephila pilipes]|uniref:Uncharacterized protein n=1 Tax=Nephila pilipes TaxID=299642 RepID=A0A8X6MGQ9_NEPPI|nr:hypothetical protein NPIL_116481 [Nephila pilipes]GFS73849.1 hypothetical protein NPIL_590491 [Nephila pilipes]
MPDKIHEMKSEKEVCAASPNVSYNDVLFARIAALEQIIDKIQINDRSRSRFRNHHRNISRSRSRSIKRSDLKSKYYFYILNLVNVVGPRNVIRHVLREKSRETP